MSDRKLTKIENRAEQVRTTKPFGNNDADVKYVLTPLVSIIERVGASKGSVVVVTDFRLKFCSLYLSMVKSI